MDRKGEKSNIGLITLNRPKALNALNDAIMRDISDALDELEADANIGAIVMTGSQKAFAGMSITLIFASVQLTSDVYSKLERTSKKWKTCPSQNVSRATSFPIGTEFPEL